MTAPKPAKKVQYILIGDFVTCPQCGPHLGADHDGGILTPMKCHFLDEEGVECPCILDGEPFQTLVDLQEAPMKNTDPAP